MLLVTADKLKQIAGELDCGFRVFIHKKTRDLILMMGDDDYFDGFDDDEENEDEEEREDDPWAADRRKIREQPDAYFEIEKMESHDSFKIMEAFAETVDSVRLRNSLINALSQRKPFSKFKYLIDNSGDYREKWFAFKDERIQEWVMEEA